MCPVRLPGPVLPGPVLPGAVLPGAVLPGEFGYWRPVRTEVMRWVLKPSQCIRPT